MIKSLLGKILALPGGARAAKPRVVPGGKARRSDSPSMPVPPAMARPAHKALTQARLDRENANDAIYERICVAIL